jgi:hypothetical protein
VPLQMGNGHCAECGYRLAWIVIRGKSSAREAAAKTIEIGAARDL